MVAKSLAYSSAYPKVNYFHKYEGHFSLKNIKGTTSDPKFQTSLFSEPPDCFAFSGRNSLQ